MYQRGTGDNCDKCHLSSGLEKSKSNKGDVITAFKRHVLNCSCQLVGKPVNGCDLCQSFCVASIVGTGV